MENLEELKKKVDDEKAKLIVLAGQNTDYNKEIVRLKSFKEVAQADADKISSELKRVAVILTDKQRELDGLNDNIIKAKEALAVYVKAREDFFKNAEKEKADVNDRLAFLRVQRTDLENEVASLSTKAFNAGVTINTQNFTISENERRVSKSKMDLSEIERRIGVANMELRSVEDKIKEKAGELQAKVDILTEQNNKLVADIEENNKKLTSLRLSMTSEYAAFEADVNERVEKINVREKALTDAEAKCKTGLELNARTTSALNDREQELKLLELKIKELARKKDIDAQIATLSK